jgi:diguanylate cyclase (GGDEF)-like protein/PAS domain S-box-containing protein
VDEQVYKDILDQMVEGVYFVDRARRITFWNPGAERLTGYSSDEVVGHGCSDGILRHVSDEGQVLCLTGCPLAGVMRDGTTRAAHVYLHHKAGYRVPVSVTGQAIYDDLGRIVGSVELFHARPTTTFAAGLEVDPQAEPYSDPVTGIGTRRLGAGTLEALLASVNAGMSLGVLFVDVDHFKAVNDAHGHRVGDEVLRMVGQNLAHGLRNGDFPIRWGGDEFVGLCPAIDPPGLARLAARIRMLVETSWLDRDDTKVQVTVSVGATMARAGDTVASVRDRADRLMYASKDAGRNRVSTDLGLDD